MICTCYIFGAIIKFYAENIASITSLIPEDAPIYHYSMCNGMEYNVNPDLTLIPFSYPSIGTVNCTEGTKIHSLC